MAPKCSELWARMLLDPTGSGLPKWPPGALSQVGTSAVVAKNPVLRSPQCFGSLYRSHSAWLQLRVGGQRTDTPVDAGARWSQCGRPSMQSHAAARGQCRRETPRLVAHASGPAPCGIQPAPCGIQPAPGFRPHGHSVPGHSPLAASAFALIDVYVLGALQCRRFIA